MNKELTSDLLLLLAELTRFLETRHPDTTLGITLHSSLRKVLREKVKRMTERLQMEIL